MITQEGKSIGRNVQGTQSFFCILVLHVWLFGVGHLLPLVFASFLWNLTPCSCRISNVHLPESPSSRRVEGKHKILLRNEEDRPRNWKCLEIFRLFSGWRASTWKCALAQLQPFGSSLQSRTYASERSRRQQVICPLADRFGWPKILEFHKNNYFIVARNKTSGLVFGHVLLFAIFDWSGMQIKHTWR